MRLFRALTALTSLSLLSGCGYIHFGRLPKTAAVMGDAAMGQAYSNLSTEHKILKQELVLARKEGDTLRAALERGATASSPELISQLNATTRELATLRANYAKLQAERSATPSSTNAASDARLREIEEQLASSLRNYTQLQEDNARLRQDLDRTRAENSTLASQLKTVVAQNDQAQSALSQLNTELLAEKEARARVEQVGGATRAQLDAVLSRRDLVSAADPTTAVPPASLQLAKAPPADASAVAELRTNPDRLAARSIAPAPANPAAPAPVRTYVVQPGDTLEKIATKYFGDAKKWVRLYAANNDLLRDGRPLKAGMELEVPEN